MGAEKGYQAAQKRGIPKYFFVSRLDEENSDFFKSYQSLKDAFGVTVCPIIMPHVDNGKIDCFVDLLKMKAYSCSGGKRHEVPLPDIDDRLREMRDAIAEAVAQTSEELMDKYFSGEEFTSEELIAAVKGFKPMQKNLSGIQSPKRPLSQVKNFAGLLRKAEHMVQKEVMQLIGPHQLLGFLSDLAVLGRQQLRADRGDAVLLHPGGA